MRGAALAVALTFSVAGICYAQRIAAFNRLAGQWSGSGTIELSNGTHESIKCRAAYDVLSDQRKLQLNIRCASDSFNFDLRASANYSAGAITGNWSEVDPKRRWHDFRQGRWRPFPGRGQRGRRSPPP